MGFAAELEAVERGEGLLLAAAFGAALALAPLAPVGLAADEEVARLAGAFLAAPALAVAPGRLTVFAAVFVPRVTAELFAVVRLVVEGLAVELFAAALFVALLLGLVEALPFELVRVFAAVWVPAVFGLTPTVLLAVFAVARFAAVETLRFGLDAVFAAAVLAVVALDVALFVVDALGLEAFVAVVLVAVVFAGARFAALLFAVDALGLDVFGAVCVATVFDFTVPILAEPAFVVVLFFAAAEVLGLVDFVALFAPAVFRGGFTTPCFFITPPTSGRIVVATQLALRLHTRRGGARSSAPPLRRFVLRILGF